MVNINKIFSYINKRSVVRCSWCEKAKTETKYIIGGPRRQFICDSCVDICVEIAEKQITMPARCE